MVAKGYNQYVMATMLVRSEEFVLHEKVYLAPPPEFPPARGVCQVTNTHGSRDHSLGRGEVISRLF